MFTPVNLLFLLTLCNDKLVLLASNDVNRSRQMQWRHGIDVSGALRQRFEIRKKKDYILDEGFLFYIVFDSLLFIFQLRSSDLDKTCNLCRYKCNT